MSDKNNKGRFTKGDNRINKGGRPKGSKNKIPSDKEIQDSYLKEFIPTLEKLVDIRDSEDSSEAGVIKVSCKILDTIYNIMIERDKQKTPKDPEEEDNPKSKPAAVFSLHAVEKK